MRERFWGDDLPSQPGLVPSVLIYVTYSATATSVRSTFHQSQEDRCAPSPVTFPSPENCWTPSSRRSVPPADGCSSARPDLALILGGVSLPGRATNDVDLPIAADDALDIDTTLATLGKPTPAWQRWQLLGHYEDLHEGLRAHLP